MMKNEKNTKYHIQPQDNPARCEVCRGFADWWVTVGDNHDYISHDYCDEHLPEIFKAPCE